MARKMARSPEVNFYSQSIIDDGKPLGGRGRGLTLATGTGLMYGLWLWDLWVKTEYTHRGFATGSENSRHLRRHSPHSAKSREQKRPEKWGELRLRQQLWRTMATRLSHGSWPNALVHCTLAFVCRR